MKSTLNEIYKYQANIQYSFFTKKTKLKCKYPPNHQIIWL